MERSAVKSTLETSTTIFAIHENGVGHMHLKDNSTLDIPEQLENLKVLVQITMGVQTPFYVTAGKNVIITKDARDNAIAIEDQSPVYGMALVVENLAYRLIADFYNRFNKPKNPYKIFSNAVSAEEWCLQFVKIQA